MCSWDIWESIGVAITAGATALTSTPDVARSLPKDFVMPMTAALDAEYAAAIGLPSLPAIEATFTIRPLPRGVITRAASRLK